MHYVYDYNVRMIHYSLFQYILTFISSNFSLKSILSDIRIDLPPCFLLALAWKMYFLIYLLQLFFSGCEFLQLVTAMESYPSLCYCNLEQQLLSSEFEIHNFMPSWTLEFCQKISSYSEDFAFICYLVFSLAVFNTVSFSMYFVF